MTPERTEARIPQTAELLSLLVALALVAAIALLTYRTWTDYSHFAGELSATQRMVNSSTALLSELKDAETGQRGFLLTGSESYLKPYDSALKTIPKAIEELDRSTEAQPDQARRAAALKPLVSEKLGELATTIDLFRVHGSAAALAEVRTDRGKKAMDQIRLICDEIQAVSHGRLYREAEDARASAKRAALIGIGGSVALFVLLVLSVITIQRATRRRQELISALQQSEEQTRQGRDWLQTTVRCIGDGVIATDPAGNVSFLNEVAQSLTGWKQEEAFGTPLDRIFLIANEETGAAVENPITRALRENRTVGLANHTALTSKDGRTTAIDDTAAPIRNSQGEVIGGVLVFRDVTERRKVELRDATDRERYRFLAEASQELSSSLDYEQTLQHVARLAVPAFADYCMVDLLEEGKIRSVAHAHVDSAKDALLVDKRRRFPLRIEQHHPVIEVLRTGKAILRPRLQEEAVVAMAQSPEHLAILRQLVTHSLIVVPLKARENTLGTMTFATGQAESGRPYDESDLVWATEVAQRAALALDNARLFREAHEAREAAEMSRTRLAVINDDLQQFTFATSHDLREPLRTINIYTQLLQRRNSGKLDEQSVEFLNFILAGASQMERLINALLEYSKAGEVTNEPLADVELEAVLASTLASLHRTIREAGGAVSHDPLPRLCGSELQFGQLFQNLISNAVKYRRDESPKVHISARSMEGVWLFAVSDNGQGIPPDQYSNIFAVFTRLHGQDYPGTGIGLATCRKIVERYGGRIWVESEVGKGSTFFFTLPGESIESEDTPDLA